MQNIGFKNDKFAKSMSIEENKFFFKEQEQIHNKTSKTI